MITLVSGTAFCLSTPSGEIVPGEAHGFFFRDSRLISTWSLLLDGHHLQPMSIEMTGAENARFVMRRRPAAGQADSTVLVLRDRSVNAGLQETITVENMGREGTTFELTLHFAADFADLFAVKEGRFARIETTPAVSPMDIVVRSSRDPSRGVRVSATEEPMLTEGSMTWQAVVPARSRWQTTISVQPIVGNQWVERTTHDNPEGHKTWVDRSTDITVDNRSVSSVIRRSKLDLDALRMKDSDGRTFLAAGAPWFMTLFGRDSIFTAWMCLPLDVNLATGTLQLLASMQGHKVDPATEEQPGRILHELRLGPDSAEAIGGSAYYGTVDATQLFVMLLAEARRWGADPAIVRELLPAADAALTWIFEYGDSDKDGFVEYRRATDRGLFNQGWKDSFDGINDASGAIAEPPIALCEAQGYTYAALIARADLASAFDDDETATELKERARKLKDEFARAFWLPDRGWYAVALDGHRRPIDALTSNVAHCLWTGIATDEHAEALVTALSGPTMRSGYGLRTLATDMGAYNPMSYHNGSVWPHDTAIAVAGLMRYAHIPGAAELARQLSRDLFDAAGTFNGRLPELFCGFPRAEFAPPIPYPTSCSPQAWASAAPLLVVRSLLGLEPDEPNKVLRLKADLPSEWGRITFDGMRLGHTTVRIRACGDEISAEGLPPAWHVVSG